MEIIFENDDIVAVNKPAGLMVHPDGRSTEKTLSDWVVETYPETRGVGEPLVIDDVEIDRPGIIHRLDRDTSGAIVIAKNQEAFEHLKSQFKNKEVQKIYHTFVYGNIKEDTGVVDKPIGKSRSDFRQRSASKNARGKLREAITHYNVLQRGEEDGEHWCLLEVKPKTGRTHQIRVHMKEIQHPIVCDPLYTKNRKCLLEFERLALHARSISFLDMNGEFVSIEAPYPDDFTQAILL